MSAKRYRASLQLNNFICSSRAVTETKSPVSQARTYGHFRFRASQRAYLEALSGSLLSAERVESAYWKLLRVFVAVDFQGGSSYRRHSRSVGEEAL